MKALKPMTAMKILLIVAGFKQLLLMAHGIRQTRMGMAERMQSLGMCGLLIMGIMYWFKILRDIIQRVAIRAFQLITIKTFAVHLLATLLGILILHN